jgi:hypothetical protein
MKKKILFLAGAWLALLSANGQSSRMDTAYAQYLGKYTFPPDAPVKEIEIEWSDSALSIGSAVGSTPLQKISPDSFRMVLFNGAVVFKRSPNNNVSGVNVYFNEQMLDGKKEKEIKAI